LRHYEPAGVLIGLLPRRIIAEIRCGLPQVDNALGVVRLGGASPPPGRIGGGR
jgi:hypothetical protein